MRVSNQLESSRFRQNNPANSSAAQLNCDALASSALSQATNTQGLMAMSLAAVTFSGLRALATPLLSTLFRSSAAVNAGSWTLALTGEVATFRATNQALSGQAPSESWHDLRGFVATASDFCLLKGFSGFMRGESWFNRHAVSASAMVAGESFREATHLSEQTNRNFAERFSHAFASSIALEAGGQISRIVTANRLQHVEQNLQRSHARTLIRNENENLQASPAMAAAEPITRFSIKHRITQFRGDAISAEASRVLDGIDGARREIRDLQIHFLLDEFSPELDAAALARLNGMRERIQSRRDVSGRLAELSTKRQDVLQLANSLFQEMSRLEEPSRFREETDRLFTLLDTHKGSSAGVLETLFGEMNTLHEGLVARELAAREAARRAAAAAAAPRPLPIDETLSALFTRFSIESSEAPLVRNLQEKLGREGDSSRVQACLRFLNNGSKEDFLRVIRDLRQVPLSYITRGLGLERTEEDPEIFERLLLSTDHLHLTGRAATAIQNLGISLIGELIQLTRNEMGSMVNTGRTTIDAMETALVALSPANHRLCFGWHLEGWELPAHIREALAANQRKPAERAGRSAPAAESRPISSPLPPLPVVITARRADEVHRQVSQEVRAFFAKYPDARYKVPAETMLRVINDTTVGSVLPEAQKIHLLAALSSQLRNLDGRRGESPHANPFRSVAEMWERILERRNLLDQLLTLERSLQATHPAVDIAGQIFNRAISHTLTREATRQTCSTLELILRARYQGLSMEITQSLLAELNGARDSLETIAAIRSRLALAVLASRDENQR